MAKEEMLTGSTGGENALNAQMADIAADGSGENYPLENYLVDMTADVVMPDFRLTIGGVGVLPKGGICVVTGAAKQGKTQFLNAMASVLVSGREFGSMRKGKGFTRKVLFVDTEQSLFEIHNNMNRLYRLAHIPEKTNGMLAGIPCYSLRPLSPEQRVLKINEAIAFHQPDVLIIDGARDLLNDFNDPVESNAIATWLLQTLDEWQDMTIIAVVHTNPGTDKIRGHLGTELTNKCSDRFTCVKENGVFSVTHISRQMEMRGAFTFRIENGDLTPVGADVAADVFDPETTFEQAVTDDGGTWAEILKRYKKLTGCSEKIAREVFREKAAEGVISQKSKNSPWKLAPKVGGVMYKISQK